MYNALYKYLTNKKICSIDNVVHFSKGFEFEYKVQSTLDKQGSLSILVLKQRRPVKEHSNLNGQLVAQC